jgi:hypothetical protein
VEGEGKGEEREGGERGRGEEVERRGEEAERRGYFTNISLGPSTALGSELELPIQ